ncbi:hypothetical protein FJV41_10780 [Myxococcus llanfairpwllgwyngyllgogerychwyrndrobwllllantysiliogogogochensis]|uniref:Uncharacterized protein n=1 Tax=Myxococcus llanfairpwllgwyngyllgogerychwyrndrobwllllantysiliogogogochensis TaxID=2590453 RepID=A0A540X3Z6_9BACT|nr:hypothetical protein [Myxococcus llanfairpwllgwyngyllgogerychwyrndrobwllllantysiliogogogochensis]TQF15950.1 hypothetical protein FJV41_10780 [Myxococcus llanfairpwllgwyngyllgogerychwyrndrobwllllantysiliogogogochensis]
MYDFLWLLMMAPLAPSRPRVGRTPVSYLSEVPRQSPRIAPPAPPVRRSRRTRANSRRPRDPASR